MGSYMAYRHHLPENEAAEGIDAAATVQLNPVELTELDDE